MSLEGIGNTELHLIKSEKVNPYKNILIYIKLENQNPTKSIKDRMVHHVVSKPKYRLSDEITFVSASSGNTGTSLAYICKLMNFGCIIVTNTKCSEEKINACKDFGAEVIIADSDAKPNTDEHYQQIAVNLASTNSNYFDLDQYGNKENIEALIKVYSSMKPGEAASLIEAIDDDLALKIVSGMKSKIAGKVLSQLDVKVAKRISETLAGKRMKKKELIEEKITNQNNN